VTSGSDDQGTVLVAPRDRVQDRPIRYTPIVMLLLAMSFRFHRMVQL